MSEMDEIEREFRETVKGKPYRPSNGTEGMIFIEGWCGKCWHDRQMRANPEGCEGCEILARSFAYSIDDPEYPKEWRYDEIGLPMCAAFRREELGEPRDEAAAVADLFATPPQPAAGRG